MKTSHIPFSMPTRGWALSQNWVNLTFMHWEVDRQLLKKHIPEDLKLETFKGKTYIGTIPFRMEKIRPRYLPSVPFISNFPEFNIRAYVSKNGISGVLFLTLDAESRITSMYAPWAYGLPYVFAKGKVEENQEGGFSWQSKRKSNGISIKGESKPSGSLRKAEKNSLEEFLFEREPEKEDFVQSLIDEVTEGGTITLLVLVSVTSIVLAGYFVTRGKEELDFDWEEDDEF